MDEEVYTVEDIFERDTPLTENLLDNSDGLTLSPITMLRRYMAKKELQKQNEKIEDDMEMDEESMGYMNGGGIGSMMQPRQNYAIGGDIEQSDFGLQNIINYDLPGNQNTQTAGFFSSDAENALENIQDLRNQQNIITAPVGGDMERLQQNDIQYNKFQNLENEIEQIKQQNINDQEFKDIGGQTARLSYDKLNNGTMTDANTSLFNQENVITPMSKPVTGITDRNRGQIIERNPSAPFNRGFTMADVAGENLPSGIMSGYTQPSADYPDMIRNPEGFPNALQNLERFQDNRFSDLEFQEGFNFKDAPNEVSNLSELYQNRNFIDNPRTGFFDKNIMSKGNPDASLVNKIKQGSNGIMDFISKIPTPLNLVRNMMNPDPNAPSYQTYDPTGKIDYSKLNTTNLNDFYDSNPKSETYGTTRFDRAKPGSFASFRTLKDYFNRNKNIQDTGTKAAADNKKAADAIKEAEARQAVLNQRQAAANRSGSGYRSDRDNSSDGGYGGSSKRSADNRSSDLGFSDIRLKDNIKLVGKSPSDINIYNFTYLNNPTVYQGVMAQEVPWASVKHDNGYLMVDYNKVDVDFKRQ